MPAVQNGDNIDNWVIISTQCYVHTDRVDISATPVIGYLWWAEAKQSPLVVTY